MEAFHGTPHTQELGHRSTPHPQQLDQHCPPQPQDLDHRSTPQPPQLDHPGTPHPLELGHRPRKRRPVPGGASACRQHLGSLSQGQQQQLQSKPLQQHIAGTWLGTGTWSQRFSFWSTERHCCSPVHQLRAVLRAAGAGAVVRHVPYTSVASLSRLSCLLHLTSRRCAWPKLWQCIQGTQLPVMPTLSHLPSAVPGQTLAMHPLAVHPGHS